MKFKIIFIVLSISFLGATQDELKNYPCICPGFRRPVTTFGPAGNLVIYDNLCVAKCNGIDYGGFAIKSRTPSSIRNDEPMLFAHPGIPNEESIPRPEEKAKLVEEWIENVKKETVVWRKANRLLDTLLRLSSGGAPPCVCPGISRTVCRIGPSGVLHKYENICFLKCQAHKNRGEVIGVSPSCNQTFRIEPEMISEEKELEQWYNDMEVEINFYRPIFNAMQGMFPESSKSNVK